MEEKEHPIELMRRAKAGDTAAFGDLYQMYLTPIYRYVFVRVREKTLAEDIAQTVFLKVFEARERFEDTGTPPLAYFLTVARNTLIDHFRKKKDVLGADDDFDFENISGADPTPLETSMLREDTERLHKALRFISSDQREAITLRYLNNLSNEEIASYMGKTEENVRQLQSRGLRALRTHMKDSHE